MLDAPGRLAFSAVRWVLNPGGSMVSTRPIGPDAVRTLALRRPGRQRFAAVMTRARSQDLTRLVALVDDGRLQLPVDRVFPAAQAPAAHRHAEGSVRGKVVLALGAHA